MWEPGGGTDEPPGIDRQSEVDQTSVEMQSGVDVDKASGAVGTEISDPTVDVKDKCEENKNQLDTLKEIMLRNKQSLKQKEEEVQEYARKLSKIKTRVKISRRSRDAASSVESTPETARKSQTSSPISTSFADVVDDVRQARTPKAKSSLLQKKLAENKIIFEQRSREMTENKRAVEEKVEAIRQKLEENDSREFPTAVPVQPDFIHAQAAGPSSQLVILQDKDNRIAELNNRVIHLEAEIIDLKENLREKDSVIKSKTKAVTLVSEDLSKRSKSTLDTLEDTKGEMRTMQANFVLVETSLKHKVDSLLTQLQKRDEKITEFEEIIERLKTDIEKQKITDTATADFSRSTLDTLAETKEAMKTMQENFVLIESSLKAKNDNLLEQLQDRDSKLSEAEEKIFRLESGVGTTTPLGIDQLQRELHTIKQSNRLLQDEKYELQKAISEYQAKLISNESVPNNGLIEEKDNRIAELENLVEELRKSNELLLEESKSELQSQIVDLTLKNEEYSNKVNDLEKLLHNIETEKNALIKEIPEGTDESKEDTKVLKLSKELDDLNKSMIKLKAQHKGKVKSLQKKLESFKKISDANAELVKLGNQVALLEEEKGNLQLSLVDFDELKVSAGDWQERISDLESKLSAQASEIDSQVQSIATLENQKLDLMQELHTVKQEVSALEAENAESENLRVTAEMKIVELEEQLDSLQKSIIAPKQSDSIDESEKDGYLKKIDYLTQENNNLIVKLAKWEEKGTSDAGSTESFETIHETDRMELLKKIEILTQENNDLIIRLTKLEERTGSMESFDNLNERDRNELMKKIDLLTHENNELNVKLAKLEEKGSSDSGSTESFERIPSEPTDTSTRLDILTQENNELVIKVIKLEEKLAQIGSSSSESPLPDDEVSKLERRIDFLTQENSDLIIRITKLQEKMEQFSEAPNSGENTTDEALHDKLQGLVGENNELVIKMTKLEESSESLKIDLDLVTKERDELKETVAHVSMNPFAAHLIEKLSEIHQESETPAQDVREQVVQLLRKLDEGTEAIESGDKMEQVHRESITDTSLEKEIEAYKKQISEQKEIIKEMEMKIAEKQVELDLKAEKVTEYEAAGKNLDVLRAELDESLVVMNEWKLKCEQMEEKMQILETEKASIAEELKILEAGNDRLVKEAEKKDARAKKLKKTLDETIARFEERLEEERSRANAKEEEVAALKEIIVTKENDLRDKYEKLQREMITIDSLQEDINKYKMQFQEQRKAIEYLNNEISELNAASLAKNNEVVAATAIVENLRKQVENSKTLEEFAQLTETLKQMQERIKSQNTENIKLQRQNEIVESDNNEIRNQLIQKEHEIADFLEMTRKLEDQLKRAENSESELTVQVSHLENALSQNHIYMEDLKKELRGEYKKLELVKAQHVEDSSLQNRRLEDLLEELNSRNEENENLKKELREWQGRLEEITKDDAKSVLQSKIIELEAQLTESQEKAKLQLDKMKKIAANLKKKAAQCQELETKVAFLEEKFNSEKSEKDLINSRIFENERVIGEKDNRISELEIAVASGQQQLTAALESVSKLEAETMSLKEKMNSLLEQVTEMGNEVDKLRSEINAKTLELAEEKLAKENILAQYEAYKLDITKEMEMQQLALDEAKESTRELGVRMEVMEGEYVKQLTLIQNLKAENGLLSSKEAQINERLENVEKESEERRCLLEQTQQQKLHAIEKAELQKAQTLECELREDDCKSMQEQGRNSVEALEAKLQERDAVIESLEMELGKSNDKVNRLQETIVAAEERRYSLERKTELLGAELEQSVRITEEASFSEDMLEQRLATLMAKDEAISDKLNETIEENNELTEKIKTLQDLNVTLQERIDAVEEELMYNRETNDKLQNIDLLYSDLLEKANVQENELKKTQQELRSAKLHIDNSEREVTAQINQLDADKKHLLEKCEKLEDLRINLIQEVESLKDGVTLCRQRISELETEVETYKDTNSQLRTELARSKDLSSSQSQTPEDVEKLKSMIAEKDAEIENYQRRNMQLQMAAFDPKSTGTSDVFGTSIISDSAGLSEEITRLNTLLSEKENERIEIYNELERRNQQLASLQLDWEKLSNDNANIAAHSNELIQRNDQLLTELHNMQSTYDESRNEISRLNDILTEKNLQIEALHLQLGEIGSGLQERENNSDSEIRRLTDLLASKDNDIAHASAELNAAKAALDVLTTSQRDNEILIENKNVLIDQLETAKSAFESQLDELKDQRTEAEKIVNEIIAVAEQKVNKFYELSSMENTGLRKVALTFQDILTELEALRQEKDQLLRLQVSNQNEIDDLKKRIDNVVQSNSDLLQERKALQQQFDDPLTSSTSGITSAVETRGQEVITEREIPQKQDDLTSELTNMSKESRTAEETVIKTVHSEVDAAWDSETGVKVELDDEGWGWSAEEAQLEEQHQLSTALPPALSNLESQLRTRIAELEDEIKDLTAEKVKFDEENKSMQLKNVKLLKKLKEFKLQNDQLQRKLKQQSSGFADLDSAIEEELKSQIEALEKMLKEAKEEQRKAASEKEHLQKRLEVLTAANERFVEMKERQDMDVEVWQIRNKELTNKLQALEWQLQEVSARADEDGFSMPSSQIENQTTLRQSETNQSQDPSTDSSDSSAELCKRYKEEIDDLKEEMEALASENEQLQQLLEELKVRLVDTEAKLSAIGATKLDETKKLIEQKTDVQGSLTKLQEEYNLLRKQYEQSLMDANDQVTAMRQNNDLVRMELDKKSREFDNEKELLLQEIEGRSSELKRLEASLQLALRENSDLMERMTAETSTAEKLTSVSVSLAEVTELLNARVQEVADLKQEAQQKYLERTETENRLRENIAEISHELTTKQQEIEHLKQVLSDKVNEFAEQRSLESSNLHTEMDALKLAVAEKENALKNMERVSEESENLKKNFIERETNLEIIASELTSSRQQLAEKEYQLEQSELELSACKTQLENAQLELRTLKSVTENKGELESWVANLQIQLSDKERELEELKTNLFEKTSNAEWYVQEIQRLSDELQSVHAEMEHIKLEVQHKNVELERLTQILTEKDVTIDELQRKLEEKLKEPEKLTQSANTLEKKSSEFVSLPDSLPRFTMSGVDDLGLEPNAQVASLETQLREKEAEIEHLKYTLDENTYPALLQQLQDNINQLYIDKDNIEQSLQKTIRELNDELAMKQKEIENLNEVLANQQELIAVERTSALDQETIAKLQNELHMKEQEINELQYVIAQKNSEISMQANLVSQSDDYEAQETLQRLKSELYASQQEIQNLKSNLAEKDEDVKRLKDVEILLEADRELVSKLTSEKESVREEADRILQTRLIEKEAEIDALKQQLTGETQQLLAALQFKETDIENLRIQMEQLNTEHADEVHRRDNELVTVKTDLAERERRLAELSVTKDTEIHNLRVQIHEKDVRISDLIAMSDEEEKQLVELRGVVERKEEEINNLKTLLAETVQEYEVIQKALRRNTSDRPTSATPTEGRVDYIEGSGDASIERTGVVSTEGELDLALYMLHHRDVRCEELTLELMQLLEERDTLQLRLSNAIRVNEELRQQTKCTERSKQESLSASGDEEPLIEHPSPSKSDGPVEIAKEALNVHISPIGEDKNSLAAKLSQLHTVDQRRDVRLCDERESRHEQQMSFVSRRDMLKALPPEAAARLVNANYTLSRDVQSQSSVLMNWLWGKSTPKVMHM